MTEPEFKYWERDDARDTERWLFGSMLPGLKQRPALVKSNDPPETWTLVTVARITEGGRWIRQNLNVLASTEARMTTSEAIAWATDELRAHAFERARAWLDLAERTAIAGRANS